MNNEIVNKYLPIIYSEAVRMKSRLPYKMEVEDLVSSGIFALIYCMNSAGTSHGLDRNYIRIIRHEIFTELRNMAKWVNLKRWYSLSRKEQLIFVLHKYENIPFQNIAELLDFSETQVEHTYGSTTALLNK